MKKLFLLFDKYKSFEDNLKKEHLWLFIPLYLFKTALIYSIVLTVSYLLIELQLNTFQFLLETYTGNIDIEFFFKIIWFISLFCITPILYILVFSRTKLSIHPYISSFIAIFFCFLLPINKPSIWVFWFVISIIVFIIHSVVLIIHQKRN